MPRFIHQALTALLLAGTALTAGAQMPPAPLLSSGARLFALGTPRALGAMPSVYSVRWRGDGGAFAALGQFQSATPPQEKAALLRGDAPAPETDPSLLVYDVETGRMRIAGRFNVARDGEYFREARWVGPDLYVSTATLPTAQSPQTLYRLYFYSPKTGNAVRIDESPNTPPQLEPAPINASFLVERAIIGEEQRFRVIADGRVLPVNLGEGQDTFGLFGWSHDGKGFYAKGRDGRAALIHYAAGAVSIEAADFDPKRDLFVLQPQADLPLFVDREAKPGARWQLALLGRGDAPDAAAVPARYEIALSSCNVGEPFSLAPDASAVVYVAQETLFFQRVVELRGRDKATVLKRLKP